MDQAILNNILESMSDSLIVVGHEGDILYANRATEEIIGFGLRDLKQQGLAELFFLTDKNYDFNQLFVDAVWHKSINQYSEVDYHHPDGSIKRLAATTSYLLGQEENQSAFVGIVALFKDITENYTWRRKEEELIREKEKMAGQKMESIRKLAMGVAHEIRNPVVTIGGFAARILRDEKNLEETRRYASNILEDAGRLERAVEKVHQYCNLPQLNAVRGDLGTVIENAVEHVRPGAVQRKIELIFHESDPGPRRISFDASLIKMALINLLENAVVFSPDNSRVAISLHYDDQAATIEVTDSGPGIRERDLPFIFDPFFSTKPQADGMGLAIVERILQEHMGRIEVASASSEGTTMRITLPCVEK